MLETLRSFWSATEPALDGWAARNPEAARALQWSRRRRSTRLDSDVDVLATEYGLARRPTADAPSLFPEVDQAAVFGWLYVAEGSTLGGALIARSLSRSGFTCTLESFVPYAEGPGPMWRAYLAELEAWTADEPARTDSVVAAGVATFEALERRLEPAPHEVAA